MHDHHDADLDALRAKAVALATRTTSEAFQTHLAFNRIAVNASSPHDATQEITKRAD